MLTPTPTFALLPRESSTLTLQAERRQPAFRSRINGTIRLRQYATTLVEVRVRAKCRSWLRAALTQPLTWLVLAIVLGLMFRVLAL